MIEGRERERAKETMCVRRGRIGVCKECATERGNRNAQERIKVEGEERKRKRPR